MGVRASCVLRVALWTLMTANGFVASLFGRTSELWQLSAASPCPLWLTPIQRFRFAVWPTCTPCTSSVTVVDWLTL